MEPRDRRHLVYIRESILLIQGRLGAGGPDVLRDDLSTRDGVLWRLQTLAEATGRLSAELKERHPDIPWREIYGFRNIAAHAYLELSRDIVWEIVTIPLPVLDSAVTIELGEP